MFSNAYSKYSHLEIKNPDRLFENTSFINKVETEPTPDIVGYGHIHTPFCVRFKNKTLYNSGSVGIPVEMHNNIIDDPNNKFSTLASYIILEGYYECKELNSISFNLVRVPYNIQKEIDDLENSNMPNKESIIKTLKSSGNFFILIGRSYLYFVRNPLKLLNSVLFKKFKRLFIWIDFAPFLSLTISSLSLRFDFT